MQVAIRRAKDIVSSLGELMSLSRRRSGYSSANKALSIFLK